MSVLRGWGRKFLFTMHLKKNVPGPKTRGSCGSENDTLLPMTMTRDRQKFWNGPSWRSKVIIRKPWWRTNKKQEKK